MEFYLLRRLGRGVIRWIVLPILGVERDAKLTSIEKLLTANQAQVVTIPVAHNDGGAE